MLPVHTEVVKGRPSDRQARVVAPLGPLRKGFLLLVACTTLLRNPVPVMSKCPNKCSGHGTCGAGDKCTCYTGWTLQDCSGQACQSGTAWVDKATAANTAHAEAECSNRGSCDYATGLCDCSDGFEGSACEKSKCPNACSGHGVCMSLYDVSRFLGVDSTGDGFGPLYTNWEKDSVFNSRILGCCSMSLVACTGVT